MISDIYFNIWADGINRIKTVSKGGDNWKYHLMITISMAMALQFGFVMSIIPQNFYRLKLNIFPGDILNAFFSGFILFLLPFLILNYLLIYRNNKYEKILDNYKYKYNGFLYIGYTVGTFFVFALLMILLLIYKIYAG